MVRIEIADPAQAEAITRSIAQAMAADLIEAGADLSSDRSVVLALINRRWTSYLVATLMDRAVECARAMAPAPVVVADWGGAAHA